MFSLIVTIIAVALVALLAFATSIFTGDAFLNGKAEAEASKYINEGQQLVGAIRLFQADNHGTLPQHLEAQLVPHYMTSLPKQATFEWDLEEGAVKKLLDDVEACREINIKAGLADPEPRACDEDYTGMPYYCCLSESAEEA